MASASFRPSLVLRERMVCAPPAFLAAEPSVVKLSAGSADGLFAEVALAKTERQIDRLPTVRACIMRSFFSSYGTSNGMLTPFID